MSFSSRALQRVREAAPAVPLVQLLTRVPVHRREGSLPRGVGTAGVSVDVLRNSPAYVARLQRAGHAVHVWTVDTRNDVRRCLDAGVDAIITNRPDEVLDVLGRRDPG